MMYNERGWKVAIHLLVVLLVLVLTMSGCAASVDPDTTPNTEVTQKRFVTVPAKEICDEYILGMDKYLADGSKEHDSNYYRYVVDRVSKRVYIEIRETGQHSSGVVWIECLDENGNHLIYTGDLEGK